MIRKFEMDDLTDVMNIWLESNIKAHDFIEKNYWQGNYELVKEMLPNATIFTYVDNKIIRGFVGLIGNHIAGIFVDIESQSKGIGKTLLHHVKEIYSSISLQVYKNNDNAVQFYLKEDFVITKEQIDENTKEIEYVMYWEK
ncbi:N-acetyltransferase [Alkalibaculum sp. M08DMB]|uniref:N-acetyltransferase n=1 Tax=Alkalibaculum sporogenes TaxID=2655001 RepID=A0A6A7K4P9_9FIRM|nr:N-acetyltransferase [Alkalibaculum sporogenes]MPW24351.1 N-acetyltransferase [Alkalibaculum sporogenes]